MEMCTPMDGQNSLLLFANTKEDSVSGYVYIATQLACYAAILNRVVSVL